MLYKNIHFPFTKIFQKYTLDQTAKLNTELLYIREIKISEDDSLTINKYLNERGISDLLNILSFKRKDPIADYHKTHIDSSSLGIIHCSVVIPVSGCQHTEQFWYNGDYEIITKTAPGSSAKYTGIRWKNIPEKIGSVEINNNTTLVKTDIPHGVYSYKDEYRTTCTLRFVNNENFDYLAERLSI